MHLSVRATVFVVDPDPVNSQFVVELVRSRGLTALHYEHADAFWQDVDFHAYGCLVSEVVLPGMSGIQLQEKMRSSNIVLPIILMSSEPNVSLAVRAMKSGAIDFLGKPCVALELWESIQAAIEINQLVRQQQQLRGDLRSRLELLTDDEYQVMRMMLDGEMNKTIARCQDVSLRTVDLRRSSIMRKMHARTLVELAQMLAVSDLEPLSRQLPPSAVTQSPTSPNHCLFDGLLATKRTH